MATIECRNNRFRVIFYHSGRRHTLSMKTDDLDEANNIAGAGRGSGTNACKSSSLRLATNRVRSVHSAMDQKTTARVEQSGTDINEAQAQCLGRLANHTRFADTWGTPQINWPPRGNKRGETLRNFGWPH